MANIHQLKNSFSYAMHGCGAYKGLRQTNTKEALLHWYEKGVRIMEIDMAKTDDEDYVAVAHYLKKKDLRRLEIFEYPECRTKDWFMHEKLFKISTPGLTPMALESVVQLLNEKQDLIVMFDLFGLFKQEEAKLFTEKLSGYIKDEEIWDRCLLETYNKDMIHGVRNGCNKANIIACARFEENMFDPIATRPDELLKEGVLFVSYPWFIHERYPNEIKEYADAGLTVFSRTKSNRKAKLLICSNVSVNIVANAFEEKYMFLQELFYMLTYIKRLAVKTYIHFKY